MTIYMSRSLSSLIKENTLTLNFTIWSVSPLSKFFLMRLIQLALRLTLHQKFSRLGQRKSNQMKTRLFFKMAKSTHTDLLFYKLDLNKMSIPLKDLRNLKMNSDQEYLFIKQIQKQELTRIIITDGNISKEISCITSLKDHGRMTDSISFCFTMSIFFDKSFC